VQALYIESAKPLSAFKVSITYREPLVGFAFGSSFSAAGLCEDSSSSLRGFFLVFPPLIPVNEEEGRFPFTLDARYVRSVGGDPRASEPCEDGEEALGKFKCEAEMC
jgi:hypothetical protein